ncbi:Sulfotransferase domain-containing protein [Tangfeifania diversioriginum]|uniref:Sulfotransferase domain-containing protein n=1 Tax=Tangfeifania diversioriginum TaxID=1168035 RepID=A0A1M6MI26_9BACT|nr:sulfotransferase domain-containing protein [Tangfeifania diversioriginum]SHJ83169.1 Sulfotransferase domain-containing protein [Tangfeifania diversioriginum]
MDKKPNFFIVGTAKSGTTTLYYHLSKHKDVFFSKHKEPYFFSTKYVNLPHNGPEDNINDERRKKLSSINHYLKLFVNAKDQKILAEASTDYLYYSKTANDISKFNPNSKILIVLRNPIERAFSAYYHQVNKGRETLSFSDALKKEESRIENNFSFIWRYKQMGLYSKQIQHYLNVFPSENIKILLFDDIKNDVNKVIKEILNFLEIDTKLYVDKSVKQRVTGIHKNKTINYLFEKPNAVKRIFKSIIPLKIRSKLKNNISNWNIKKPEMSISDRKYLIDYFKNDIKLTENIIGRDLSSWINE